MYTLIIDTHLDRKHNRYNGPHHQLLVISDLISGTHISIYHRSPIVDLLPYTEDYMWPQRK
jgi:hypothetical protein